MPFIPDNQPVQRTGFVPDKQTVGGFVGNVGKSGVSFVGNTAGALINTLNPNMEKNTIANMVKLGASLISVALPGEQGNEDLARNVGKYYAERYGGLDNAWNSFYNDPVGVAADVSTVLTGVGGIIKGGVGVATRGAQSVSLASNVAKVGRFGSKMSNVGRAIDPITASSRLLAKVPAKGLFRKVGTKLSKAGDELPTKGLGNPAKQADLAARSGKTVGQFIDENNLWDRTPESAAKVKTGIINRYDALALKSGKKVPLQQVISAIDDELQSLSSGENRFSDSAQSQVAELIRRKNQLIEAAGGSVSEGKGFMLYDFPKKVQVKTLTRFRRNAIDPDIPQSMFNLDARGSGTAQGAKKARDILRSEINASNPELERLGLDYGMAKGVEDIFRKSQSRSRNRQLISLSKVGTTGIGGMLAGIPGAVAGYAVDQITTDPRFLKVASKTLKTTGKAMQDPKLPQVPNWAKTTYEAGKVGRMVNLPSSTSQSGKLQTGQDVSKPKQDSKLQTDSTLKSQSSVPLDTSYLKVKTKPLKSSNPFARVAKVKKGSFY